MSESGLPSFDHDFIMNRLLCKVAGAVGYIVQYGCIAHCTLEYVGDFVLCSGPSMEPTIRSRDVLLTDHISVASNKIQKGDIVIAKSPSNPRYYICKRVLGTEGDRICDDDTAFYKTYTFIPRGHVWLEGDNKDNSTDSRVYGPIPYGLIRSKVIFKLSPFSEAGFIQNNKHNMDITRGLMEES